MGIAGLISMIHIISRRFCNPIFFSANNFSPFKTTIGRIEARNMATPSTAPAKEPAWHASLPAPRNSTPDSISRDELLEMFSKKDRSVKDFVLVDLRRTDFEGGTIRGSINLPAQSLYSTIPSLYTLFSTAGVRSVIWYCGSSRGRGNRAAGWFADYIKDQNNTEMESRTLQEGIKGWATGGMCMSR